MSKRTVPKRKVASTEPVRRKKNTAPIKKRGNVTKKPVAKERVPMSDEEILEDGARMRLKKKIHEWMNHDDSIKELADQIKEHKDAKKKSEEAIMRMIEQLQLEESTITVSQKDGTIRGNVYRHRSVTKGAIKESIIKEALMEIIHNERQVDQLVKKIEDKRPINERYYLKRTKGNQ